MKAERRHELQENQLAAWLSGKYVDARPYITAGVAILAGIALVWLIWNWYSRSTASAKAEVWNQYYRAANESNTGDESPLREFIGEHSTDPVGIAARQRLAIVLMDKGADSQLLSRVTSMANYEEAIELFEEVRTLTDDESLKRFASLQIALCHESRYALDDAIEEYEGLVEQYPGSAEAERATLRLEDLKNPATREFYAWHRTASPTATTTTAPNVVIEPATDLENLPDSPPTDPVPPTDPASPKDPTTPKDPTPPENPTPPTTPTPPAEPMPRAEQEQPATPPTGEKPADAPRD